MPNWATQRIYTKTKDDLQKIKTAFCDKDGELDFRKVIPMPESVKNTTAPGAEEAVPFYLRQKAKKENKTMREMAEKLFAKIRASSPDRKPVSFPISEKEWERWESQKIENEKEEERKIKRYIQTDTAFLLHCGKNQLPRTVRTYALQRLTNRLLYGTETWYDWAWENWGTKWNADNTYWGDNYIEFQTAWSPAKPIVKAISKQLHLHLLFQHAEEQMTEYAGTMEVNDGEVIKDIDYESDSKELFFITASIMDPDQCSIRYDTKNNCIVTDYLEEFEEIPEIYIEEEELDAFYAEK